MTGIISRTAELSRGTTALHLQLTTAAQGTGSFAGVVHPGTAENQFTL